MFASFSCFTCLSWINVPLKLKTFSGDVGFFLYGGAYAGKKKK